MNGNGNNIVPARIRFAVIVAIGTSPGGICRILKWLLASLPGLERLGVLHIDSDGTLSFAHLPTPLTQVNDTDGWGPNSFVHIPPPRKDFVKSIQRGERAGFDHIPPAVLDIVSGEDGAGVGGIVTLGNAAGILHEPRVRGAIRRAINRVTDHRNELNDHGDSPLMVFEIVGCLGGTGGALDPVHDVIVDESSRMGIQVSFQRTVLFPGVHPTKDMDSSMANAAAWLREFSAKASGRYLKLARGINGGTPSIEDTHAIPAWIVSDMNAAPGKTSTIGTSALFTLVGYWHWLWLTTPLGPRLEQSLVDFQDDALGVDIRGERRVGRSFGIAFVSLNHERIERFSSTRLVRVSLEVLHGPVDADEVEGDARQFNRNHRLHEGAGFSEISTLIRSTNAAGQPAVDQVSRFRNLLEDNLSGLEGMALLRDAPGIFDTTVAQTADAADRYRAAREGLVTRLDRDVETVVQRWLWDPERGASYVQLWLAEEKRVFEAMVDLASEDRRQHGERIERTQATVQRIEEEAIPRFLDMGSIRRWFNRRHIDTLADSYSRDRRALEVARREDQARAEAITALQAIATVFDARHAAITALLEELASAADAATAEEERVRQWDGMLHNPNGFRLDDDLEGFYRQVIARPGDEEVAGDIAERLAVDDLLVEFRRQGDILVLGAEPGRIAREIESIARRRVHPRVEVLHVEDELFRRHTPGSVEIRSFLRERDREAHERITLSGTSEHDNPVHVLRFLCADPRRGAELVRALNDAAYTRAQAQGNIQYELIPSVDPERIALVQVRLSFPPSQIGIYPACAQSYDEAGRSLQFERSHTEFVGRFVPRPGERSTRHDAEVALVKAFALAAAPPNGRPAPIEVAGTNGSNTIILNRWKGERETVGVDLASERHVARQFDVRVELATRFYSTWRLHGPDALIDRLHLLAAARTAQNPQPDRLASAVAPLVGVEAVEAVLNELAWYGRNTDPKACVWSRSEA